MSKDVKAPEKGPPRILNLEASQFRTTANSYPRLVTELARAEVKMLTDILHLDNTQEVPSRYETQIQQMVEALPKHLRKEWAFTMPWTQSQWQPTALCEVHRSLNSALINDILQLVQKEVTQHFRKFDAFAHLIGPVEAEILASLRALKGIWTKPEAGRGVAPMAWPYQINGCAACMLARVAADKYTVRNLRVMLQSRTRTRKEHRARRLMPFIDECTNRFGDDADELYGTASQLAINIKKTRKACIRAWHDDPNREHKTRRERKHDKESSGRSSSKHRDGQNRLSVTFADPSKARCSIPSRQQDNQGAYHTSRKTTSGRSRRLSALSRSQNPRLSIDKPDDAIGYRSQRSGASSPESQLFIPKRPVNPEPPSTIPSPIPESPSAQAPHQRAHRTSDLDEQIDEVIESYQTLRLQDKVSSRNREPKTASSAATRQVAIHKLQAAMARRRERELTIAAIDGMVDRSEELGREYRQLVSSGLPPSMREYDSERHRVDEAVEVPLIYQYSPSEYSDSDWTDAEYEDSDFEALRHRDPSLAVTTWSFVCEEANVI